MRPMHASAAGVELSIAKGWKPNMYLTNMAIAHFQEPSYYIAPDIFPILPVPTSSGNYYVFNKAELALDQVQRKPAFGKVAPAVFSHSEETYSVAVDQIIIGVDQIAALNYQRSGAPANIDPRRAKTRMLSEQMKIHLDKVFSDGFFKAGAWANVKTGVASSPSTNQFLQFNDANADIIGYFDELKRDMLLNGRRLPNRLTLGYDAYVAIKNHPQFLERVTGSGSTPNPALVNAQVIAAVLGIDEVRVLYGTRNIAQLGQAANMAFNFNAKDALLTYCPSSPSLEEPSAGYIITWDMLGNGSFMVTDAFEGEEGTHSEFVEGLMATAMKKTCDDLAFYLSGAVA